MTVRGEAELVEASNHERTTPIAQSLARHAGRVEQALFGGIRCAIPPYMAQFFFPANPIAS